MAQLISALVGGLTLGAVYALVGLGIVLIFRATEVFNFAHGEFMLLGAFLVGKWQADLRMPFGFIVFVSLIVVGATGALLYRVILRKTVGRPHFIPVIATLGFASVADGVMYMVYGTTPYSITIPGLPSGTTTIFGASFSTASLVIMVFGIALSLAVVIVFRFTKIGIRVRAAGQDALLASQGGVNVHWVYIGSWAFAAILAAVAGITYGATNVVSPSMIDVAFLAIPAVMLGGLDSIFGALIGGLLIGVLQAGIASYGGGQYVNAITYVLLLAIVLIIPQGLFGTKRITRV